MDLNFYSDLTDGTGQHDDDPEFLDPQSFNGFDSDNKVTPSHGTNVCFLQLDTFSLCFYIL